jgi:hypothetical protein
MRKFGIILLVALVITHFTYLFLENGIKKFSAYSYPRLVEIIEGNTNYDVLFLGTSRTQVHINPAIMDTILGLNTYNAGKAGASSLEVRMLIEAYLIKHKTPKYLVYNIDHLSVLNANKVPNSALYLFFLNNNAIYEGLKSTYNRVYLMKYVPFTRIMNLDDYYRNVGIQGNFGQTEMQKGPIYYKGFASNDNSKLKEIKAVDPIEIKVPSLIEMNRIIEICKQNKIKLIFHYGPILFDKNKPTSFQRVKEIEALASQSGIDFLKLDTLKCFEQNDFYDMVHLNRSGTSKYSSIFAKALKPMLVK